MWLTRLSSLILVLLGVSLCESRGLNQGFHEENHYGWDNFDHENDFHYFDEGDFGDFDNGDFDHYDWNDFQDYSEENYNVEDFGEEDFPSKYYNELPEDVLDESLCFLYDSETVEEIHEKLKEMGYFLDQRHQIMKIIGKLKESHLQEKLSNFGRKEFHRLTRAGKHYFCEMLENMPEAYHTCGYQKVLDGLAVNCDGLKESTETTKTTTEGATETTTEITTETTTEATTASTAAQTTAAPKTTTTAAATTTLPPSQSLTCEDLRTINKVAVTTRIVGGVAALQGEFDSFASLKIDNSFNPVCGATIINTCTVVTAAHCLVDKVASDIIVQVGDHTNKDAPTAVKVTEIFRHENYDANSQANDIAILKIKPIVFSNIQNTAAACVASTDFNVDGQSCTAVGVGTTTYGGQQPADYLLQKVTVPAASGENCTPSNDIYVQMTLPEKQICAGENGKDSCQGDSGGPLYCKENGLQVLTGIVSYGTDCGKEGYPGVYVHAGKYRDWIAQRSNC